MVGMKRAVTVFMAGMLLLIFAIPSALAGVYPYGPDRTVIGLAGKYKVKGKESLIEIARKFDLGYNEITVSNPGVDAFVPGKDAPVTVPSSWVLPDVQKYSGIVVNLSELRLYYFFERNGSGYVSTFPIGIGSQGKDTPVGEFTVIEKIVKPAWHVPKSIREEKPELPAVVPPGPNNPLGSHALRLSIGDVLIHGTNRPWAVGRRDSHGCMRMYPEDIPRLFKQVPNGVPVAIVRQPVKAGMTGGKVYVEVHTENAPEDVNYFNEAVKVLTKKKLLKYVNTEKLYRAVEEHLGTPVEVD